ncbi:hypothetical protein CONLIGDRAFT_708557 [Coniochaeta ligniaria NRRL 30616]|uniref:Secreted protein n=1 Tax=Coniochaeta ligniaria NRRL 30616 TaxID=1408157 RepID=A0A1J7IXI2_9PEZI|nr:hypothetical protein CONLIGDRAFT_708557 [Coniochaeta ligniaria NRRL 30616]
MRFHTTIGIVLAFTARAAIPRDIAPGLYAVEVVNGTEVGDPIRLDDLPDSDPFNTSGTPYPLFPRGRKSFDKRWYKPDCYPFEGTEDLDHPTADAAKADLMAQCGDGHWLKPGHSYYAIKGCVAAYFCHWWGKNKYYHHDARCTSHDAAASFQEIDNTCGTYKPGQRREDGGSGGNRWDIAYGVESYCTSWGHDFCGWGA